jgi:MFS family permease
MTTALVNRQRVFWAVVGSRLFHEPLLVLYGLLAFILYRDFGATPLQISALMMLKPVGSIVSLHWSHWINRGRKWLKPSIFLTGVLGRLPFFLFPFIDNVWLVIGLAAFFMVMFRGGMPPFMEALKLNVAGEQRAKIFSRGLAMGYAEGVILGIGIGILLDWQTDLWRWLFPCAAAMGIIGTWLQSRLPVPEGSDEPPRQRTGAWRQTLRLMRENASFRRFQIVFFVAAFGLMMIFPALPIYFEDILGLSYTQLAIAIAVCKGIGFVISSPQWAKRFHQMRLFHFLAALFCAFGLFGICLIAASTSVFFIYVAYLLYGIAQGGSELVWHMCGPIFAKDEDSAPYSSANVVMVGIRGCLGPPVGALLLGVSPLLPLIIGSSLFFASAAWSNSLARKALVSGMTT